MRDLAGARIQPAATAEVARLGEVVDGGAAVPALVIAAPARLTWPIRLGEHADIDASVAFLPGEAAASSVIVRIGISDERSYEELFRQSLAGAPGNTSLVWHPVRADLRAYSGWKFSLFYQPSRITWNLIVAVDPAPGGSVAWRTLTIRPH